MDNKETEVIFPDDPRAATLQTVTGWVSRDGRFWGNNEDAARYDGCTHTRCACGNANDKGWTKCDSCREKAAHERWGNSTKIEYLGDEILYSEAFDKYFMDVSDLQDHLDELDPDIYGESVNNDTLKAMMLYICVPNRPHLIDEEDIFDGCMPDDEPFVASKNVASAIEVLNTAIKDCGTVSWSPSKVGAMVAVDGDGQIILRKDATP